MAGLNCRVTVGLLGVLLLGAARLARGWGECGAASARSAEGALGFEGLHRPPRWGAGGTDGWGPPEARLRGVPRREWWPYTLPHSARPRPGLRPRQVEVSPSGEHRGGRGHEPGAVREGEKGARTPGPGNLAEVARRALGGSTWIIDGAGLGVRRELHSLAHPLPQRLGQRDGARKRWFGATTSHLFSHLFPCPSAPFSLSRSLGTL